MSSYIPVELTYDVTEPDRKVNLNDIILIHGLTQSKQTWRKFAKTFANHTGRRVYALDMRNHGEAQWTDDCSFGTMVKDVLNFMNEKDIKQVIVIGHSMGAKIAMDLALAYPDRVEKIILEDFGPATVSPTIIKVVSQYLGLLEQSVEVIPTDASLQEAQKKALEFVRDNLPDDPFGGPKSRVDLSDVPFVKKSNRYVPKCNLNAFQKWLRTPEATKASEGLYTKPALFIYGTRSEFCVNEDKDYILKLFASAKLHGVEGATHLVHDECPEEFSQVILKFLKEL